MKSDKQNHGSGKTFFTRQKSAGQSWTQLRDEAIRRGEWKHGANRTNNETEEKSAHKTEG
jgi:hypothetical protein